MQERRVIGRLSLVVLAAGMVLCWVQPAYAVRLVKFEVSLDGKAVLETSTGDNGQDADTVWRYLKRLDLRPVKGFKVEADRGDSLKATLRGTLVIDALYGGRAEVTELKLVREKEGAAWRLAPDEVERTFKSRKKPK